MSKKSVLAAAVLALSFPVVSQAQVKVDPALDSYTPVSGVSGNLKSLGSDTLNNLMTLWAEGFNAMYPNVKIEIEGKGSSTAPAALIAGTAHFGPMSRPMKGKEEDDFEKKYGYKPTAVRSAIDALALYVHKLMPFSRKPAMVASIKTSKHGGMLASPAIGAHALFPCMAAILPPAPMATSRKSPCLMAISKMKSKNNPVHPPSFRASPLTSVV
jgi:hypothetical protein